MAAVIFAALANSEMVRTGERLVICNRPCDTGWRGAHSVQAQDPLDPRTHRLVLGGYVAAATGTA